MILVTCKEDNCPTPYFYVNPKGGKIPISFPIGTPDIGHPIPEIVGARIAAMSEFQLTQEVPEKFTNEEIAIIKDWYELMQKQIPQKNLGITEMEKVEATDYLVVYCESNHQNYILLKNRDEPFIKENDN